MIKLLTVIGARPQIIKAAALSRAIRNNFSKEIKEVILHTGQHYDENMSEVFFNELNIPKPDYNLNVGSASHGLQTAEMLKGIENVLQKEHPDFIVLYGDTNSTLAGSIAASKLHIPIIHIEAGLRSFNKSMPEEINRIICDHVSTLLFSPTLAGFDNLIKEGFKKKVKPPYSPNNPFICHCGDVMYDNSIYFADIAETKKNILKNNKLEKNNYILVTLHRNNNTDNSERIEAIFRSLNSIAYHFNIDLILPLHPRTAKVLETNLSVELYNVIKSNSHIKIISPVSFLEMIMLEKYSKMIITDSGGVQKESYFFNKPCIILRTETEWIEIVDNGTGKITDVNEKEILDAYKYFADNKYLTYPLIFGDGKAAEFICKTIVEVKNN